MADTTAGTTAKTTDETEFASVLVDLARGKVHADATTALADVIEGVARTAGKGKLTLVVTVEPQDSKTFEDTGVMVLSATVKADVPKPAHAPSVFYGNGLRGITRDDPNRDDPFRDRDDRD
jgi:hypothetical protein